MHLVEADHQFYFKKLAVSVLGKRKSIHLMNDAWFSEKNRSIDISICIPPNRFWRPTSLETSSPNYVKNKWAKWFAVRSLCNDGSINTNASLKGRWSCNACNLWCCSDINRRVTPYQRIARSMTPVSRQDASGTHSCSTNSKGTPKRVTPRH